MLAKKAIRWDLFFLCIQEEINEEKRRESKKYYYIKSKFWVVIVERCL